MLFTPYLKSCGMNVANSTSGWFELDRSRCWTMGCESMLASGFCHRCLTGVDKRDTNMSIWMALVRRAHCTARRSGLSQYIGHFNFKLCRNQPDIVLNL